jgi:hypothetical protein
MEIKKIKISELKKAEYNPRIMLDFEMEALKQSIQEFGFVEPVVVNKDMTIIGGHQRAFGAEALGWDEVPCFVVDLDKKNEKRLNLALNKINGSWDEVKLTKMIGELKNEALGFRDEEVNQFLARQELMAEQTGNYEPENDEELKKLFDRNEKVAVQLATPDDPKRCNKLAFYVETWDEYKTIKDAFETTRKGELDKDKLLTLIENA